MCTLATLLWLRNDGVRVLIHMTPIWADPKLCNDFRAAQANTHLPFPEVSFLFGSQQTDKALQTLRKSPPV